MPEKLQGKTSIIFSAFPDYATTALLTRATDGKRLLNGRLHQFQKNTKGKDVTLVG